MHGVHCTKIAFLRGGEEAGYGWIVPDLHFPINSSGELINLKEGVVAVEKITLGGRSTVMNFSAHSEDPVLPAGIFTPEIPEGFGITRHAIKQPEE